MRLLVIVVGVLMAVASTAGAETREPAEWSRPTVDETKARAAMRDYFEGEINGGYVLAGMGVAGLVAGGLLYRRGDGVSRGASYPLLGVGVAHLAAGIYIGIASERRIDKFEDEIHNSASGFAGREHERMAKVSRSFTMLKVAEVVLVTGGLTMVGIGHRTDRPRLKGAGIALAIEAALTLGFDVVAAKRAMRYRDGLDGARVAVMYEQERGVHGAGVAFGGRF